MSRWEGTYLSEDEIRKTIAILKHDGDLFECRILDSSKRVLSGYFVDADTLIRKLDTVDLRGRNVYITVNHVAQDCYSRVQRDTFMQAKTTTTDADITQYDWLFVDVDPQRTTGVSSTDAEFKAAEAMASKIASYLEGLGFQSPVKALSGNGCHLFYRIHLGNNKDNRLLIENCLKTLSMLFDTDEVKVDTTNYNPSRICKLHGTLAQKGANSKERPHRMSRIFSNNLDVKITERVYLEKLVAQLPAMPKPERPQRVYHTEQFDLEQFLSDNGLTYKEASTDRAKVYRLDHCPFDHNHTDGDAKIFSYPNGAIAFKCHHNSCSDYRWQDVRKLFDPHCYDYDSTDFDDHIQKGWEEHNRNKANFGINQDVVIDTDKMPDDIFRTARQIYEDDEPVHEFIRSGIDEIDGEIGGLEKTRVSVISGLRASGKSTIIGQIVLSAINDGHNVVLYSGEMNNRGYLDWLIRQAAGRQNVEVSTKYRKGYGVKKQVADKVVNWMGDRLFVYNNKYGNDYNTVFNSIRKKLIECRADLCIIDNLAILDLRNLDQANQWNAQTLFVKSLETIASDTNTHIVFVAHPRKTSGFLRLTDIAGSANLANLIDNAFIVHRWNRDFEQGYMDTYKRSPEKDMEKGDNIIEIAKERENGTQDKFITLWFEESTKRMKNAPDEYIMYGWQKQEDKPEHEFRPVDDEEEIPF